MHLKQLAEHIGVTGSSLTPTRTLSDKVAVRSGSVGGMHSLACGYMFRSCGRRCVKEVVLDA